MASSDHRYALSNFTEAPEAVPSEHIQDSQPEIYYQTETPNSYGSTHDYPLAVEKVEESRGGKNRIFGLSPPWFWLSLLLTLVLVAGAIGGGIGGGLASRSRNQQFSTETSTPSRGPSVTLAAVTRPSTISSTTSSTAASSSPTSSPPAYRTLPVGYTGCPTNNGTNYSSLYGSKFQRLCGLEWAKDDGDITATVAGNFELCMDQCAMWNIAYGKQNVCQGAIYVYKETRMGVGNCALKNFTIDQSTVLISDRIASGMLLQH